MSSSNAAADGDRNAARPAVTSDPDLLRRSGLAPVGDVPWGTHFCQFYRTKQDLVDVLVPYFKAGLEDNELCMWVTAEPLNERQAELALRKAVPDLDRYLRKGQIEIIPHTQWYLLGGRFDQDRVLKGWVGKLEVALERGFDGLRLTGNTFWLEKADWRGFTDYEAAVNAVIGSYRMIALCTYSTEKCGVSEVADVISNHEFALIRRAGEWSVIESSEHKRVEFELRQTRDYLENLIGYANAPIIVWDPAKKITRFNRAFEHLTGYEASEVVGQGLRVLFPAGTVRSSLAKIKRAASGEYWASVEIPIRCKDGRVRVALWNSANVYAEDGVTLVATIAQGQDITERKIAEEALRAANQELQGASEEMGQLNEELAVTNEELRVTNDELQHEIEARKKAQAEIEVLSRFPAENPNPVMRVARGETIVYANEGARQMLAQAKQPHEGLPKELKKSVAAALESGSGFVVDHEFGDRTYSFVVAPIAGRDYVNLYGRDITRRRLAEEGLKAANEDLQERSEQLSQLNEELVASNEELRVTNDELQREIEERKRAEEALRQSREDLKRAQAVAHTGSWQLDVQRNELLWSDETYRIFGIPLGTALTYEAFLAAVHPEDRDYVNGNWKAALRGEPYDIEHRIVAGDEAKWIRERAELEFDEKGTLIGGFGTAQDVTELKQAEVELQQLRAEAERRAAELESFFASMSDGVALFDAEGQIVASNEAAKEILGAPPGTPSEELSEQYQLRSLDGEPVPVQQWPSRRALRGERFSDARYRIRTTRGEAVVSESVSPVRNAEGRTVGAAVVFREVSAQVEFERRREELYQREHHIAEVLQQALVPPRVSCEVAGISIAVRYQPAMKEADVGGDFYDILDLGEGRLGVLIGDVAGKGLAAAMRVAAARYAVRSYALLDPSPASVLTRANRALLRDDTESEVTHMLTAFFAVFDTSQGMIHYASAGHEPPVVLTGQGEVSDLAGDGMPFGVTEDSVYEGRGLRLRPGDMAVMVTDGITEARSPQRKFFGRNGMAEYLSRIRRESCEDVASGLLDAALEHAAGNLQDDAAIIVVQLSDQAGPTTGGNDV